MKRPQTGQNNGKNHKELAVTKQRSVAKKKKSAVRRLLWANVIALLALLITVIVTLQLLGLLDSIYAFFF